jgi:predicted AAA+ superfamily ATPase
MFHRSLSPSDKRSFFLFGARGTGKSTLLKTLLPAAEAHTIDLLTEEARFALDPKELIREAEAVRAQWIVIDEIQKVPELLDIVHALIERKRWKFALTGSSARKLMRGGANLLAGRAFTYSLFPLTHRELGDRFDLRSVLEHGSLPEVFHLTEQEDRHQYLRAYAQTYLKEEIQAEPVVRRLNPFRKFLEVSAQSNGKILNFTAIARDVGSDPKTVQEYFRILEDTLLGTLLEPYHASIRKRQRQNPKFYFFDPGVTRALARTLTQALLPQTYAFGNAFEHFVINEILRLNAYGNRDYAFSYLRTKDDAEIDLIVERPGLPTALIEIKSSAQIREHDVAPLARLHQDFRNAEAFCLSCDPIAKRIGAVHALPWEEGIRDLGL